MTLKPIPVHIIEANAFVEQFHRHNKPVQGAKFAIGATDGDRLLGVAIVGRPVARLMQDGLTAEVTRVCVLDDAPKGTCSFLYGRCWRIWQQMGGERLLTYTLTSESGASLRGAGWKIMGQTVPGGWDRNNRARDWQPIYGQQKFRWEAA